ncbi:MAG: trypsin-like peptidase domain-containing protein [Magnetococcales bacterium]|nr:trypsin-like peptidase domain-containing protein [Magnetococcales bacterium]
MSNSDFCGKVYHKYLYLVGVTAVLVMIGSYWYVEYYEDGKRSMENRSIITAAKNQKRNAALAKSNRINPAPINPAPSKQARINKTPTLPAQPVVAQAGNNNPFSAVARSMMPSVVNVSATTAKNAEPIIPNKQPGLKFARPFSGIAQESIGSGIIITPEGYILTNYHVVENARHINVTVFNALGTKRYHADVIGRDEMKDLALLKVTPIRPLVPAALGNSELTQVGDSVIAIGSPFGLDQTVSKGIVSGKDKVVNIGGTIHKKLLQTDAAINRGNSGGPLVNSEGNVIAVNTAIYTTTSAFAGVGFAVPINMAKEFMEELIRLPRVTPDLFGQQMAAMPVARRVKAPPISANAIMPHEDRGPCESCHKILPGNQPILTVAAKNAPPIQANAPMPHGDRGPCETCHDILPGPQAVNFGMGPKGHRGREAFSQFGFSPGGAIGLPAANNVGVLNRMGAILKPLDQDSAKRLQSPVPGGVLVAAVEPETPFNQAGLQLDDIIFKVDGQRIVSIEQFDIIMGGFNGGESVRVSIVRNGRRQDITLISQSAGAQPVAMIQPQPQQSFAGPNTQQNMPRQNFNLQNMQSQPFVQGQQGRANTPQKRAGVAGPVLTEFEWMGMEMSPVKAKVVPNQPGRMATRSAGALVADVDVGSSAQLAGIKPGDIILAINSKQVDTAGRLDKAIKSATGKTGVLMEVERRGQRMFTVLQ